MDENYYDTHQQYKLRQWVRRVCLFIIASCGIVIEVMAIMLGVDAGCSINYTYIHIIRRNNNTNINFDNLKRSMCLEPYFINFPFHIPIIGYELIENSTDINPLYTLDKLRELPNIMIYFQDKYDIGDIKKNLWKKDIVISWDYNNIPELAQSLGCKNCNYWNENPTINMTDDSLFDVTWVLRIGTYNTKVLKRKGTIEFYTVSLNLENSILLVYAPVNDNMNCVMPNNNNMTTEEIMQNYNCKFVSNYNITKW